MGISAGAYGADGGLGGAARYVNHQPSGRVLTLTTSPRSGTYSRGRVTIPRSLLPAPSGLPRDDSRPSPGPEAISTTVSR